MANIILRQIAQADLDGIWDYIATNDPDRADSERRSTSIEGSNTYSL
jgi:plasmid stabilization system protein ParE